MVKIKVGTLCAKTCNVVVVIYRSGASHYDIRCMRLNDARKSCYLRLNNAARCKIEERMPCSTSLRMFSEHSERNVVDVQLKMAYRSHSHTGEVYNNTVQKS